MKQKSDNVMGSATELLAERAKLEAWIAALEQRRSTTPEQVFSRVHADYTARLETVTDALRNKADALDQRVAELTARAQKLEADAVAAQDERAEAELRAHVGEIDPAAWTAAAAKADSRIDALAQERSGVEAELRSIRDMVGAARKPTPAASTAIPAEPQAAGTSDRTGGRLRGDREVQPDAFTPMADSAPPAEPAETVPEDAAGGDAPLVSEPPKPAPGSGFDELAFLRDVTGASPAAGATASEPQASGPQAAGPQAAGAPPAEAQAPEGAAGNEPSGKPFPPSPEPRPRAASPSEPPMRASSERPLDDSLGLVLPDETPAFAPSRRTSTEIPLAEYVTGNLPIIIQGETKQSKTLKCTDCGSMNYPTEWYCERCGAELSAL